MAAFQVTPAQLRAKAGELRELNTQFKTKKEDLETTEKSLASMCEGESITAFDASFVKSKAKMDIFYNTIEQYCAALESIAAEYEKAENQNVAIVMGH